MKQHRHSLPNGLSFRRNCQVSTWSASEHCVYLCVAWYKRICSILDNSKTQENRVFSAETNLSSIRVALVFPYSYTTARV
jgi:hypothetical protein